jgi:adenylate cyclase
MARSRVDDEFRSVLTGEHPGLVKFRRALKRAPHDPRCKLCAAPFEGPGGAVLRHLGFGRFAGNPALCDNCIKGFRRRGQAGAEIPLTLLFADIRGSTGIAETMSPTEYRGFLDRFYRIGSAVILDHDGLVDKLVGDEIIGLFFGGITGPGHAAAGIEAASELMERVKRSDVAPTGAIPVGAAVHSGEAYVGTTGPAGVVDDFTALGDAVNTASRLAASAAAGELLVSIAAMTAAERWIGDGDRRTLDLRGRAESIEVVVFRP